MNDNIINNYKKMKSSGNMIDAILYIVQFPEIRTSEILLDLFVHYKDQRDFFSAEKYLSQLCQLEPNNLQYKLVLSTISLAIGKFEQGFSLLENRIAFVPKNYPSKVIPFWKGEKGKYKKIVIFGEQGLGDCFMYSRFIKKLKEHFDTVALCVAKPLVNIFNENKQAIGADQVFYSGNIHDYDCCAYICSLPHLLNIDNEEKIQCNFDYLKSETETVRSGKKLKIGICLHGRLDTSFEQSRAINIDSIGEIFNNENIEAHSVYIPSRDNQTYARLVQEGKIIEHKEIFSDFSLTRHIMNEMDLIISSDTSIVHLAGTMGKETLLMLPRLTDWRWKTEGEDSYWYPNTVKILRQSVQGEWDEPARKMLDIVIGKIPTS